MKWTLSESERRALERSLNERGELFFPVRAAVAGALAGSARRMRRLGDKYRPGIGERLLEPFSRSYRSVSALLRELDPSKIVVEPGFNHETKSGVIVRLIEPYVPTRQGVDKTDD